MGSSFDLPEHVLEKIMGGLILTYFRSHHPQKRNLHLVREYKFPIPGGSYIGVADYAIYDREAESIVALFELVTNTSALSDKKKLLKQALRFAKQELRVMPLLGLVVPNSIARSHHLKQWVKQSGFELVTYPD